VTISLRKIKKDREVLNDTAFYLRNLTNFIYAAYLLIYFTRKNWEIKLNKY